MFRAAEAGSCLAASVADDPSVSVPRTETGAESGPPLKMRRNQSRCHGRGHGSSRGGVLLLAEVNLLRRYPKAKRNIEKRTSAQSAKNVRIAREYGREYFDGSRDTG